MNYVAQYSWELLRGIFDFQFKTIQRNLNLTVTKYSGLLMAAGYSRLYYTDKFIENFGKAI